MKDNEILSEDFDWKEDEFELKKKFLNFPLIRWKKLIQSNVDFNKLGNNYVYI